MEKQVNDNPRYKGELRIKYIKRMCKQNNITLDMLIREADISTSTITNWNKKEPAAFEVYDKIIETLDKLIVIENSKSEKTE